MRRYLSVIVLAIVLSFAALSSANAQGGTVHIVSPGETLFNIANQYGVSVDELLRYNGIPNPNLVFVGQPIQIPGSYGPSLIPTACARSHTVSPGETLSGIAVYYSVSLQALAQYNRLYEDSFVYVGQTLCIPSVPALQQANYVPGPSGNPYQHTVLPGETLNYIANHYGIDYHDIMRANRIQNAAIIVVGQVLIIPGYQPQPAPLPARVDHYYDDGPKYDSGPKYNDGPKYDDGPKYAPPPAPGYDKYHEDSHVKPPIKDHPFADGKYGGKDYGAHGNVPPAPDYQAEAKTPLLPLADQPIEVVINGGSTWVGESFTIPDPNGITTLIVRTGDQYDVGVRIRSGDYEVAGKSDIINLGEFGPFAYVFRYVPPGDFDVWIEGTDMPSQKVPIKIRAGDRVEVGFNKGLIYSGPTFASPSGWYLASFDNPSKPHENSGGWSNILVRTPASGLNVRIHSEGGGYEAQCQTGSKGNGACDFAGLMAGFYWVTIDGTDFTVKTYLDGSAYAVLEFARQPGSATPEEKNSVGPVSYD
ncbi:MAG: LysM peptidoglycan-binding domain-containing protein [Anaerolineae bacterium]|nr:LysM peptidoglycan-binding domain-containing protein [Anaerolineae bacterium]